MGSLVSSTISRKRTSDLEDRSVETSQTKMQSRRNKYLKN